MFTPRLWWQTLLTALAQAAFLLIAASVAYALVSMAIYGHVNWGF